MSLNWGGDLCEGCGVRRQDRKGDRLVKGMSTARHRCAHLESSPSGDPLRLCGEQTSGLTFKWPGSWGVSSPILVSN